MRVVKISLTYMAGILWAALLILLPITSMPAVRDILHSSTVAGPSVLALAGFLLVGLIPYYLGGGGFPKTFIPFIGFFFVCILALGLSFFMQTPTFKSAGNMRPAITAIITLIVGLVFLLATYSRVNSEKELRFSLLWIYAGAIIMLIWSFTQSAAWFTQGGYPAWMRDVQDFFSLGPLYRQRAAGFALEPSWQAHMLNMLYLPLWLSAAVSGYSVSSFRLFKYISVEMIFLGLGGMVLGLTFSRVGWITFAVMAAFVMILGNVRLIRHVQNRLKVKPENKKLLTIGMSLLLAFFYSVLLLSAAYGMSRFDPRMQDLFSSQFWQLYNLNRYANALQFGERIVYWQAGWEVFSRYPLFGVGLGNAGKWFSETIPSYGLNLIEVRRLLFRASELPNIKNLWIRILAETGICGFAFFSAWIITFIKKSEKLRGMETPVYKMLGFLGIFIIIGIMLEGFSIDSFAMPYYWVSSGLVLAGVGKFQNSNKGS